MKSVKEVCSLTGVSTRTLHYYDEIGLLKPTETTESGYRLYDQSAIRKLQIIQLFKELEFPLKKIKEIINGSMYNDEKIIEMQIFLLKEKRNRIEEIIKFATEIKEKGVCNMSFNFNNKKYFEEAKEKYKDTKAYIEFEEKSANKSDVQMNGESELLMDIFTEFGNAKNLKEDDAKVRYLVCKLQNFITEHYYACTDEMISYLGDMYTSDERMKNNIDEKGGKGTADFTSKAIMYYLNNK